MRAVSPLQSGATPQTGATGLSVSILSPVDFCRRSVMSRLEEAVTSSSESQCKGSLRPRGFCVTRHGENFSCSHHITSSCIHVTVCVCGGGGGQSTQQCQQADMSVMYVGLNSWMDFINLPY
jgi:hypothetical protein